MKLLGSFRLSMVLAFVLAALVVACGRAKSADPKPSEQKAEPEPSALTENKKTGPTCDDCRARLCNPERLSVDVVRGCFEKPDPKHVPNPDPKFTADCKAVMECAYKHNCAYDRGRGPVQCYCGSRFVDECVGQGPADDAPCAAEWTAATRGKTFREVLERFSSVEYPSGWAFHLLECDRDMCGVKSNEGRCIP